LRDRRRAGQVDGITETVPRPQGCERASPDRRVEAEALLFLLDRQGVCVRGLVVLERAMDLSHVLAAMGSLASAVGAVRLSLGPRRPPRRPRSRYPRRISPAVEKVQVLVAMSGVDSSVAAAC
jgi:cysteine sulfinate desulfinase/cysteine desulfurase-like protein